MAKIKQNQKLEAKFFGSFWVLHLVDKQNYKIELLKKLRIYDVFRVLLLEMNIIKKEQIDKMAQLELKKSKNKEYNVKAICNSIVKSYQDFTI